MQAHLILEAQGHKYEAKSCFNSKQEFLRQMEEFHDMALVNATTGEYVGYDRLEMNFSDKERTDVPVVSRY